MTVKPIFGIVAVVLLLALFIAEAVFFSIDCSRRGGVVVVGILQFQCVKSIDVYGE